MRHNKPLSQLTHIVVVSDEDSFGIPAITEFGGGTAYTSWEHNIDIQDYPQVDMGIPVNN